MQRFKPVAPDDKTIGELRFSIRNSFGAQPADKAEATIMEYLASTRPIRNQRHSICVGKIARFMALHGIERFRAVFSDVYGGEEKPKKRTAA